MGYRDGRRGRRIVVGVSGSLDSLAALHRAVAEARRTEAEVLAVHAWEPPGELLAMHAWVPPGGEIGNHRSSCLPLLAAVRDAAAKRFGTALEEAFGGADPGVPFDSLIVRGETGRALVRVADGPEDLLVIGAGGNLLRRGMRPSVAAYCARKAGCAVLVVPKPALQYELEALHRRNLWHLPTQPAPTR